MSSFAARSSIAALLALAPLLVVVGCSGISVTSDYDPAVDFTRLKAYAWRDAAQTTVADGPMNTLTHARVREAVDATLRARGYTPASATASADFLVTYRAAITREIEAGSGYVGAGYGWRYGYGGMGTSYRAGPELRTYHRGTLVIDLVDPRVKALIWQGTASAELHENRTPEEREARIREAVGKIFEQFPPER